MQVITYLKYACCNKLTHLFRGGEGGGAAALRLCKGRFKLARRPDSNRMCVNRNLLNYYNRDSYQHILITVGTFK